MSGRANAINSATSQASADSSSDGPIAATGDASLDVLVGDLNEVANSFDILKKEDASLLEKFSGGLGAVLNAVQTPLTLANDGFALLTKDISKVFPPSQAATLLSLHLGIPHVHTHPPAMPIPLPSFGPIGLSGCASVLINGMPAARAGDLGIALGCGSLSPPFEVATGSSKVFIGGARAARQFDITSHCMRPIGINLFGKFAKVIDAAGMVLGVAGLVSQGLQAATDEVGADKAEEKAAKAKADAKEKKEKAAKAKAEADAAVAKANNTAENGTEAEAAQAAEEANAALQEAFDAQLDVDSAEAEADFQDDQAAAGHAAARSSAIQTGLDAAAMAMGMLMGLDPGTPPCIGALITGHSNVLIGGFPMPPFEALLGALTKQKPKKKTKTKNRSKSTKHGQNFKCDGRGEPVNPVTGANVDDWIDYEAPGAMFRWSRSYSSADADRDGPMGRGFRHGYERSLHVDLDIATYTDPEGRPTEIPLPAKIDEASVCRGYTLSIHDKGPDVVYCLARTDEPTMEFVRERRANAQPRLTRLLAENGQTCFSYDERGRLIRMLETSSSGAMETRLALDDAGHILEVRRGRQGERNLPLVATYQYDHRGCLLVFRDALGHSSGYAYDHAGRMVRKTDRNGYGFHYAYDELGRCIEEHGSEGRFRITLKYEPEEFRTFVTEVDGGEWLIEYNEQGTITRVVDPYGGERMRILDGEGRPLREVGPGAHELQFLYDHTGKHCGVVDRFGYLHATLDEEPNPADPLVLRVPDTPWELQWGAALGITFGKLDGAPPPTQNRDALGQVVEEIDAAGRRRTWSYDASCNVAQQEDRDGRAYRTLFSSWNQISAEIDPLGHRTQFEYTMRSEIARIVDPGGNESRYEYDLKDRLVRVFRHGVVHEEYVYDAGDQLIEKRDGSGNVLLRRTIGDNGLPTERKLASGQVYRYEYNDRGQVTRVFTDEMEVQRDFDWRGRLIRDERNERGVTHRFEGEHLRETTYLGRFTIQYRQAADGSLVIEAPVGGIKRLFRRGDGSVLVELGNGTTAWGSYDDEGRCLGRELRRTKGDKIALWKVSYAYSAEGDLLRVEDNVRGVTEYIYDAAHRLIGEKRPDGMVLPFVLDAAGNILEKAGLGRAELFEGNRLRAAGAEQFRYNARNHLEEQISSDGATACYRYDSSDMLVEVSWSGRDERWTAAYDGLGRRQHKALGAIRTEYYWDGERLAAEVGPTGALRVYVYAGPEALVPLMFIDYESVHADPTSGKAYYPIGNQIGVPLHIEDQDGQVAWRADHVEPYGMISVHVGASIAYALRFPGHYLDEETGLHYNRFRYYSPRLGRYLQSDPIGQSGGINVYAYPANPLGHVDVLGLMGKKHAGKNTVPKSDVDKQAAESSSSSNKQSINLETIALLEHTETWGRKIMVSVDSHQNKHQSTKIAGLKAYDGGKGSTFPNHVDLDYHKNNIAPIVLEWARKMQGYIMREGTWAPKTKYALAPEHIDFDVVASYDSKTDTIHVTYHGNPNKNASSRDF